jgi:hypothetical protein
MAVIDSEVVFNTLIAEGESVPVAYAASIDDSKPHPPAKPTEYFWRDKWIQAGMLIGLALSILWLLF